MSFRANLMILTEKVNRAKQNKTHSTATGGVESHVDVCDPRGVRVLIGAGHRPVPARILRNGRAGIPLGTSTGCSPAGFLKPVGTRRQNQLRQTSYGISKIVVFAGCSILPVLRPYQSPHAEEPAHNAQHLEAYPESRKVGSGPHCLYCPNGFGISVLPALVACQNEVAMISSQGPSPLGGCHIRFRPAWHANGPWHIAES